jgi:hypothetical protein
MIILGRFISVDDSLSTIVLALIPVRFFYAINMAVIVYSPTDKKHDTYFNFIEL